MHSLYKVCLKDENSAVRYPCLMSNPCFQRPFGETALTFSLQIQDTTCFWLPFPPTPVISLLHMPSNIQRLRLSASFSLHSVLDRKKITSSGRRKKKKKGVGGMERKGAPQDGHQAALVEKSDHEVVSCVDSS